MSHSASTRELEVGRVADRCEVLGPGVRAVVWVAGCPLRCKECVVPELLDASAGDTRTVAEMAEHLLSLPDIDGVTYSGGEPFAQAPALAELSARLRNARPELSLMSYTGYTVERLERRGDRDQLALLSELDILIDGPYLPGRHAPLRWRGSSNQRLLWLTERHRDERHAPDVPAGMAFRVSDEDHFYWEGVPPVRGFRPRIEASLAGEGITIGVTP